MRIPSRKGIAGIIGAVLLFTMLFTIGASYFLFVNSANSIYNRNLFEAGSQLQGRLNENMIISTSQLANNHVGFILNNTGGVTLNATSALLMDSSGNILACFGVGITPPAGLTCSVSIGRSAGSTSTFPLVFNPGKGRPQGGIYDLGSGCPTVICDLKVLTQRGNIFTQTYPPTPVPAANVAVTTQGAGLVQINFDSFIAYNLTAGTSCDPNTASCAISNLPKGVRGYTLSSVSTDSKFYVFALNVTNVDPEKRVITLDCNTVLLQLQVPKAGAGGGTSASFSWGLGAISGGSTASCSTITITPNQSSTLYFTFTPSKIVGNWPPGSSFDADFIYIHGTVAGKSYGQNIPFVTTLYK